MSYSEQKYQTRQFFTAVLAQSFGTATAASAVGCDLTIAVPVVKFKRRTQVNAVRMIPTVVVDDGSTAVKAHFLNGTDTFAVVTLTTNTVGVACDGTINTTYNILAAGAAPTVKVTGTATASADAMGTYNIFYELQELYA